MTQRDQLLDLFMEKKDLRVFDMNAPWPTGLGISQYGRCIKELRGKGHKILNVKPGLFRLVTDPVQLSL